MSFARFIFHLPLQLLTLCKEALYPSYCVNCKRFGPLICQSCAGSIHFLSMPLKLELSPNYLDQVIACAKMDGPISKLIHAMKYQSVKAAAKVCAELLYMHTNLPLPDYITAVPLHRQRREVRGFNQAAEIAKNLSPLIKAPYHPFLRKQRFTTSQAKSRNRNERFQKLSDAFELIRSPANSKPTSPNSTIPALTGKSILLIDDVCTTGTTLNLCAQKLKEAGAVQITALVIAHGK